MGEERHVSLGTSLSDVLTMLDIFGYWSLDVPFVPLVFLELPKLLLRQLSSPTHDYLFSILEEPSNHQTVSSLRLMRQPQAQSRFCVRLSPFYRPLHHVFPDFLTFLLDPLLFIPRYRWHLSYLIVLPETSTPDLLLDELPHLFTLSYKFTNAKPVAD